MSIGTFDVSHCESRAIGTFPDDDDDATVVSNDSSSTDDSDDCDFVVIEVGTSIRRPPKAPPKKVRHQFGRTKFTRHLPRNFCKK